MEIAGFLDTASAQLKADTPDRAKLALELAHLSLALGNLQATASPDAARAAWQRADALLRPHLDLPNGAIRTAAARARFQLGHVAEAQALVTPLASSPYRHPDYVDLVKQLQAARGRPQEHQHFRS
jgi:hypothetical protein